MPLIGPRSGGNTDATALPGCGSNRRMTAGTAGKDTVVAQHALFRHTSLGMALAVAASLALVPLSTTAADAAPSPQGADTGGNVIVVLRDQHTDLDFGHGAASSPRGKAFHSDQSTLITTAQKRGATHLRGFTAVNAIAASVTAAQESQLATDPAVAAVYPDLPVHAPAPTSPAPTAASGSRHPSQPGPATARLCPATPSQPLLEPEALQVTNTAFTDPRTPQAQSIADGSGVKVAFIADGLDIDNPDFIRADGSHVFVDYQDFSGDGTVAVTAGAEAFGDASDIAAQGRQSYDLSDFVSPSHALPTGCDIRVKGMAPGASLIGLKVFGNANTAPTSRFIEAIDYAVAHGAQVLNESFGGNPYPDTGDDPISLADQAAVAAGVTVVASTGDAGVTGTVGSPASAAGIIGVAATTTYRSYLQEGYGGSGFSNGTWADGNITPISSGGITAAGRTPDLAAPGDAGWALCTPDLTRYEECADENGNPASIQAFGGTSMSSPLTAGAAALVIEAYEHSHHSAQPSPAVVKQILTSTATDLGSPAYEQGAGQLNALKAVQAAQSWPTPRSTAAAGSALVVDRTQLSAAAAPSSPVSQSLTVTNLGSRSQTVKASTRALGPTVSDVHGTAALDTTTAPTYTDISELKRAYVPVRFTVGKNVDRLTFDTATPQAAAVGATIRVTLIDPAGVYTSYSRPQGVANVSRQEVTSPKPGTWTAYIAVPASPAFSGSFSWEAIQQRFTTAGAVSPASFALAPGASRRVTVTSREPAAPGDLSASVQLTGSVSGTSSVPLSLRAVVPPSNYSFSGTITGGNGRASGWVGSAQVYYLDVPRGQRDLGVGIQVADTSDTLLATLTGPNGQTYSWNSNATDGTGIQDYVRTPAAGRWMLTVETLDPVSGLETQSSYHVSVRYNTVSVTAPTLPDSTRTRLAQGKAVTVPVTITNTGVAPLTYFADARLNRSGTIDLGDVNGSPTFALPEPADVTPEWIVPSHSSAFAVTAAADQPVNVDMAWQGGDPEVYTAAAPGSTTTTNAYSASQVAPGIWYADLGQTGPFAAPATPGTVTVSATATGQLFDTDVTSPTGDFYTEGVAGQSAGSPLVLAPIAKRVAAQSHGTPISSTGKAPIVNGPPTLKPGQKATVLVTITPSQAKGSRVSGHLYIDTLDPGLANADELIDLPYSYTVG